MLTFDTETRGFRDYDDAYSRVWMLAATKGAGSATTGVRTFSFPIDHPDAGWTDGERLEVARMCLTLLEKHVLNGHNVKFDMRVMDFLGRRVGRPTKLHAGFDTMCAAHLLNEELPMKLETQAGMELGVKNWGKGKIGFGLKEDLSDLTHLHEYEDTQPELGASAPEAVDVGMVRYCARDTAYTHLLYELQRGRLREQQGLARLLKHLILPGLDAYTRVETTGIWLNRARVLQRQAERQHAIRDLTQQILQYVSEDFRATAQLSNDNFLRRWIFGTPPDGLGLTPITFTEKKREPQVNDAVLAQLDHPAMTLLRDMRGYTKDLQFFEQWLEWADDGDRLHPRYNFTGTVTGRRSNDKPNLQQVPRDTYMRSCIGAPPGWVLLEVDYAQLEVRLVAWLSGDQELLRLFREERDVYVEVARQVLGITGVVDSEQRRKAKAIVLGFQYGMGPSHFAEYAKATYGVEFTLDEAKAFREQFFRLFSGLAEWHNVQRATVKRLLQVPSPLGRMRHLLRVLSFDGYERGKAERQAINSPVQGTGGDLTLASVVTLVEELPGDEALIVGDIHDAILFQLREDVWRRWAKRILTVMENPPLLAKFGVQIPLRLVAEGKVGHAWGEGTAFTLETLDTVEVAA